VSYNEISNRTTKRIAAASFMEVRQQYLLLCFKDDRSFITIQLLQLKTWGLIELEQSGPFEDIKITRTVA
jgi:chromatin segregation and condensation protein Rec8/ScpA/Scc1 (kleisin family)